MSTKLEFTREEWNSFLKSQKCEIFSEKDVKIYMDDYKTKQETMDEFEKSCVLADLVSLNRVEVLNEDLSKSIFFVREEQTEVKKDVENFSSDLQKSKCLIYKDTPLNRLKGIVGLEVNSDVIEKARKAEPIGTEKTYGGKLYIKTAKGWRLKPKGAKSTKEDEQPSLETKKVDKKPTLLSTAVNDSLKREKERIERMQKNLSNFESALNNSNQVVESYASELRKIFPGLTIKATPSYLESENYKSDGYVNTRYLCEFKMKTGGSYDKALAKISILKDRLKESTKGELSTDINPYDIIRGGDSNKVHLNLYIKKL